MIKVWYKINESLFNRNFRKEKSLNEWLKLTGIIPEKIEKVEK